MTKKTKIKSEAAQHSVPQTRDETAEAIANIGQHQRERERIQAAMNDELATIKQRYEEQAKPHNDGIQSLSKGVQLWCEANRVMLTQDGKTKTANLTSGEVKWRMRPPSARIAAGDVVIEALRRLKLDRFIRVKEEVNKEAILLEPEAVQDVKGIAISQKEDFVILPFETQLEEVQS